MKAVITCGGLGTRLLPFSKELPKEMAPVFYKIKGELRVIPLIQLIFEKLFDEGIREFCFITGKTKKSIENHFTPNDNSVEFLSEFYNKLKSSKIFWITQNEPNGFGDAVRYAESFIGKEKFILQAGDVGVLNMNKNIIKKLIESSKINEIDIMLTIREVVDPKRHGIVTVDSSEEEICNILSVVEKPDNPESNLAIMPLYLLPPKIFDILKTLPPGKNNEIQITDAIQKIIMQGGKVKAILANDELFFDVGTPEAFWETINNSYSNSERK